MQVKETRVARGTPPFIMKVSISPIPSPIMKAVMSPIPYIERQALEWHVSIYIYRVKRVPSYDRTVAAPNLALFLPYSCPVLAISFPF
jgi:hypothetical protein